MGEGEVVGEASHQLLVQELEEEVLEAYFLEPQVGLPLVGEVVVAASCPLEVEAEVGAYQILFKLWLLEEEECQVEGEEVEA